MMYARKLRQLKSALRRLEKEGFSKDLWSKIVELKNLLVGQLSALGIKRAIGISAFALLVSPDIYGQGPAFAPPVLDAFSIGQTDWVDDNLIFKFFDFDTDGDQDIIAVANGDKCDYSDTSSIYYIENIGSPTSPNFALDTVMTTEVSFGALYGMNFLDIDDDGDMDVLISGNTNLFSCESYTGSYEYPGTRYVENVGKVSKPLFEFELLPSTFVSFLSQVKIDSSVVPSAQSNLNYGQFTDIDSDGDLDYLGSVAYTYGGISAARFNVGFQDLSIGSIDALCLNSTVGVRNFKIDTTGGENNIDYTTYCGELSAYAPSFLSYRRAFGLFDEDGDGLKDIFDTRFTSHFDSLEIVTLNNISSGSGVDFATEVSLHKTPRIGLSDFTVFEDIDNDGDADLFVVDAFNNDIYFYENLTNGVVSNAFDNTLLSDINIHPNPASDQLVVSFKSVERQKLSVNIFDMKGSYLDRFTTSENQLVVDVSSYEKGIYLLELKVGEFTRREKVVVQ